MASQSEHSDAYQSYVSQLEKRVVEQEQLISLLNEKLAALSPTTDARPGPSTAGREIHVRQKRDDRSSISFVGSRKSDAVQSVVTTKYTQYFVSRVDPDVSAMVLAQDLLSSTDGLASVKCSKMKTKHSSYSSFHVVVPSEFSHLVESDSAWPEGSLVKIFGGRLLKNYVLESFDSDKPLNAPSGSGKAKVKVVPKKQAAAKQSNASVGAAKELQQSGSNVSSPLNNSSGGRPRNSKASSQCAAGSSSAEVGGKPATRRAVAESSNQASPKNLRAPKTTKTT